MRSRTALLIAILLLVPALSVVATHNFGHRLVVLGRVVDAEGFPVANERVQVELEGLDLGTPEASACRNNPCTTQTGATGDFRVFWHAHGIGESGTARLTVAGQTFEAAYDTGLRWTPVNAQLSEDVDSHDQGTVEKWNRTYSVQGRVWQERGGVPDAETTWVDGNVRTQVPVNITLTLPDGTVLNQTVTTTNYGDFFAQFEADEPFETAQIEVETEGQTVEPSFSSTYRATTTAVKIPPPPEEPFDWVPIIVVVALVGGAGGLYFGGRKLKEKREMDKARQRSTRKRANK